MQGVALNSRISGDELRARIKRLGMTYTEAAGRLGLTLDGLNKQMRGVNAVSRQTAIILDCLEHHQQGSETRALMKRGVAEGVVNRKERCPD
jgi:hypothetical protein